MKVPLDGGAGKPEGSRRAPAAALQDLGHSQRGASGSRRAETRTEKNQPSYAETPPTCVPTSPIFHNKIKSFANIPLKRLFFFLVPAALKDADHLLHDILTAVDTSKDGLIQYSEFKHFFEGADRELWRIFHSVDLDKNGKIDKGELRVALTRAGIAVDTSRLEEFFDSMDRNNDGVISFEEWRYGRWHSSLRVFVACTRKEKI